MKKTLYVVMNNCGQDLGEGYSSYSGNTFLGIVTSFETARNIIEYLADVDIGEKNPNYEYCNDCKKGYCGDCPYHNHATVDDEDWNLISLECDDIFRSDIDYYFQKIEVEV